MATGTVDALGGINLRYIFLSEQVYLLRVPDVLWPGGVYVRLVIWQGCHIEYQQRHGEVAVNAKTVALK